MSWSELEYEVTGWVGLASVEKARTQGRSFAEMLQWLVKVISQKSEDEDHTIKKFSKFLYIMACTSQLSSVAQLCLTLCDPMNRSTPGLPVHHHHPEFTQTHVHRVSDAIQPSHPWLSPFSSCPQSLPASGSFPMSQLFAWGVQSTGVSASASFLPKKSQGWSPSEWTGWISLQSEGLSRVFSNTIVQKHQFFGPQPSAQSNSHIHTWHWKNHSLD